MFLVNLQTFSLFLYIIKSGFQQQVGLGISQPFFHPSFNYFKVFTHLLKLFSCFLSIVDAVEGFLNEKGRRKIMRYPLVFEFIKPFDCIWCIDAVLVNHGHFVDFCIMGLVCCSIFILLILELIIISGLGNLTSACF